MDTELEVVSSPFPTTFNMTWNGCDTPEYYQDHSDYDTLEFENYHLEWVVETGRPVIFRDMTYIKDFMKYLFDNQVLMPETVADWYDDDDVDTTSKRGRKKWIEYICSEGVRRMIARPVGSSKNTFLHGLQVTGNWVLYRNMAMLYRMDDNKHLLNKVIIDRWMEKDYLKNMGWTEEDRETFVRRLRDIGNYIMLEEEADDMGSKNPMTLARLENLIRHYPSMDDVIAVVLEHVHPDIGMRMQDVMTSDVLEGLCKHLNRPYEYDVSEQNPLPCD